MRKDFFTGRWSSWVTSGDSWPSPKANMMHKVIIGVVVVGHGAEQK